MNAYFCSCPDTIESSNRNVYMVMFRGDISVSLSGKVFYPCLAMYVCGVQTLYISLEGLAAGLVFLSRGLRGEPVGSGGAVCGGGEPGLGPREQRSGLHPYRLGATHCQRRPRRGQHGRRIRPAAGSDHHRSLSFHPYYRITLCITWLRTVSTLDYGGFGWFSDQNGLEVGSACEGNFGPRFDIRKNNSNIRLGGKKFLVQSLWKRGSGCIMQ